MADSEAFQVAGLMVHVTQIDKDHAKIDFDGEIEGEMAADNHPGLFDFLHRATSEDGRIIPNLEIFLHKVFISGKKANFTFDLIKHVQYGRKSVVFYFKNLRGRQTMFHTLINNRKKLKIAPHTEAKFIEAAKAASIPATNT